MKKIRRSRFVIFFLLWVISSSTHAGEGVVPQPKYGPEAVPLSVAHEYLSSHDVPGFWAMMPYYQIQETGAGCSIATAAIAINAMRAGQTLLADEPLVSQSGLLAQANVTAWKFQVGVLGRGVALDDLGQYFESAMKAYGLKYDRIEVVHADATHASEQIVRLKSILERVNTRKAILLINFEQGLLTGDAAVGHYAPVGAYDPVRGRALVLDPDRKYYEPYWVSVEALHKSMATLDRSKKKNRGYVSVSLL